MQRHDCYASFIFSNIFLKYYLLSAVTSLFDLHSIHILKNHIDSWIRINYFNLRDYLKSAAFHVSRTSFLLQPLLTLGSQSCLSISQIFESIATSTQEKSLLDLFFKLLVLLSYSFTSLQSNLLSLLKYY